MLRIPSWLLSLGLLAALGSLGGCSDAAAPPVDTRVAIEKASGGDGKARQSEKAKAASEDAAKTHPKLH